MAASKVAYLEDEDADVPDHLLCPICFCLPMEAIYQCDEGHVVCSKCYNNKTLLKCPQCPFKFKVGPKIRNRHFEAQAAEYIKVDCTFKSNGCKQRIRRGLLKDHEQGCRFNYEKFGNPVNLCQLMGQDCNFHFSNGNIEEAVAHFVSAHGAIKTTSQSFGMEIPNFKQDTDIKPTSGDLQFWTPVIVDSPEKQCYILCIAVRNVKQHAFKCLALFMPCFTNVSIPSDLKMRYSMIDKRKCEPLKLSIAQDLTNLKEVAGGLSGLFNEKSRDLEMSSVKNCINDDGRLLINCRLMQMKVEDILRNGNRNVTCQRITPSVSSMSKANRRQQASAGSIRSGWNPLVGSLEARKYLEDLKIEVMASSDNPRAMDRIINICNGVQYKNNQFWNTFYGEMLEHIAYGALFIVASSGSVEALQKILSLRLNVNMLGEWGKTPLHYTMDDKNLDRGFVKAKCVLDAGANIRALDGDQRSLLHSAAGAGNAKAMSHFIHRGLSNVDVVDADGRTPLHLVFINGSTEWATRIIVVDILTRKLASKYARDKRGLTPLDFFQQRQLMMSLKVQNEIRKCLRAVPWGY